MEAKAAVLYEVKTPYRVETIELDEPREREVLVKLAASGLCHSDDHTYTGDVPGPLPMVLGHEGAGVVVEVGSHVTKVAPGDHVLLHPIPACGECRWCVSGRQNLCDFGAYALTGHGYDGGYRRHKDGKDIGAYCQIATFADHTVVADMHVVKIDDDIPLDVVALVGCGVTTGVGAAVNVAKVQPGDVVVVVGVGGVGTSAVQGARIAGAAAIVAVDPVEFRREEAKRFVATHSAASVEEAKEVVSTLTRNVGADAVIICVGVLHGDLIGPAADLVAKGSKLVITSVSPMMESDVDLNLMGFAMLNKQLLGHVYGQANPVEEFRRLLNLYRKKQLLLDEMVTTRYSLEQINEGYADMHNGRNVRGLIDYSLS